MTSRKPENYFEQNKNWSLISFLIYGQTKEHCAKAKNALKISSELRLPSGNRLRLYCHVATGNHVFPFEKSSPVVESFWSSDEIHFILPRWSALNGIIGESQKLSIVTMFILKNRSKSGVKDKAKKCLLLKISCQDVDNDVCSQIVSCKKKCTYKKLEEKQEWNEGQIILFYEASEETLNNEYKLKIFTNNKIVDNDVYPKIEDGKEKCTSKRKGQEEEQEWNEGQKNIDEISCQTKHRMAGSFKLSTIPRKYSKKSLNNYTGLLGIIDLTKVSLYGYKELSAVQIQELAQDFSNKIAWNPQQKRKYEFVSLHLDRGGIKDDKVISAFSIRQKLDMKGMLVRTPNDLKLCMMNQGQVKYNHLWMDSSRYVDSEDTLLIYTDLLSNRFYLTQGWN
ncbi:14803_t:CDS:10 [Funneliformis geosporum]|uniref:14803_t:CDS:1 n=1 Tax=Funneliformis geosporum TaxID=1117311 RepID=A0A9W4SD11_9GLOM|nr:14803_t:CDS:10 [Funneliformis geosporum]